MHGAVVGVEGRDRWISDGRSVSVQRVCGMQDIGNSFFSCIDLHLFCVFCLPRGLEEGA